uniref:Col_cuticle_N domain-containing protein n=1 Tax=Rhabditophanes sp. KR3021 TaxID=114890 RepID=A0AC35TNQ6_9BILA
MRRLSNNAKRTILQKEQLETMLDNENKAVLMAQRATGFLVTLCFFALPLFWSNMIRQCAEGFINPPFNMFNGMCEINFHPNDPWTTIQQLHP